MVRCADNSLYCGMTNNLEKRVKEHNSPGARGAKYTRAKQPVYLVYSEEYESVGEALKREAQVKKWQKDKKERLVREALQNI